MKVGAAQDFIMTKKAIIFDLDNTIYSVLSIGHDLFHSLFELIIKYGHHIENMDKIKDDIMRRPFQLVANDYDFGETLIQKATHLLQNLTYNDPIEFYPDYKFVRLFQADKFLVTTGFKKLQQSKIEKLCIAEDFIEIHIIDPTATTTTKKDVFADIMQRHNYNSTDILVIGDDLNSEIKAAIELNIEAVLYAPELRIAGMSGIRPIQSFEELRAYF